jgi:hypothetical protein
MLLDAMFLNPGGFDPSLILLAIAATGMIVGFAWLRRMAGPDPDREPSFWRYHRLEGVRTAQPSKLRWTPGWLATRLQMVLAVAVFAIVLVWPAVDLADINPSIGGPLAAIVWLAAVALSGTGTVWIFRIARRDPETGPSPWRYRRR